MIERRLPSAAGLAAYALVWALVAAWVFPRVNGWHMQDLQRYMNSARHLLDGQVPYRDFAFEYPPLALIPMTLPALPEIVGAAGWRIARFCFWFLVSNTAWSCGVALCVRRLGRRWQTPRRAVISACAYVALTFVGVALFPWRFDLFPALLTAIAVVLVLEGLPVAAGTVLAVAIETKLYPIALVPIILVRYWANAEWRPVLRFGAATAVAAFALAAPFAAASPHDVMSFLRYHELRGLQIESLAGGLLMAAHAMGMLHVGVTENYGALHLVSPAADAVIPFLLPAFAAATGGVTLVAHRRFDDERASSGEVRDNTFVGFVCLSLLVFILANKVLSPQYMIWLLPFIALRSTWDIGLAVTIIALTVCIFPFNYGRLAGLEPSAIAMLNARNALLVVLAIRLLWTLRPHATGGGVGAAAPAAT